MTVNVHIERLILDGVEISENEWPALQAAVIARLEQLLAEGGLSPGGRQPGHISRLPGGGVLTAPGQSTADLGHQIARAVYEGMNR